MAFKYMSGKVVADELRNPVKYEDIVGVPTNYIHPSGDGNLHVPVIGTTNNGKVLKAGATAGSMSWKSLTPSDVGLENVNNTADSSKNVASAATLTTARTIGLSGVTATAQNFNGSVNISIPVTAVPSSLLTGTASVNTTGSAGSCTGNAATATRLQATRNFALTGDVTGNVNSDLSGNVTISATQVANKSNQKVAVSKNSVTATSTRKQINFKDGSNVTISVADNATNDAVDVTITSTNTTYSVVTTSANGLMSSADKSKLDGIATGANKITLNNSVTSTSTTEAATANAVKNAYDRGTSALNTANSAAAAVNDTYRTIFLRRLSGVL